MSEEIIENNNQDTMSPPSPSASSVKEEPMESEFDPATETSKTKKVTKGQAKSNNTDNMSLAVELAKAWETGEKVRLIEDFTLVSLSSKKISFFKNI
jgi:hypothetical protein